MPAPARSTPPPAAAASSSGCPGRSSDDSAVLGDVVTSLCERVGLTAADLDVTEITDEVHGFGIARQISVRGALEMLAAAYSFDAVESDHQLKFKKRGRSPSLVIPERDLVPIMPSARRSSRRGPRRSTCRSALRWSTRIDGLRGPPMVTA